MKVEIGLVQDLCHIDISRCELSKKPRQEFAVLHLASPSLSVVQHQNVVLVVSSNA